MIDLNAIITAALTTAVAEAIKPLEERLRSLTDRVNELEVRTGYTNDTTVWARLTALEAHAADAITADQVSHLVDEAIDEIDWPERVRDALQSIDLADHADIDLAVREAINDLEWTEQLDLSQLRIIVER
jgi:NADH dehydrogenase/NADH:ubiquinone oxidoreductase subunit G